MLYDIVVDTLVLVNDDGGVVIFVVELRKLAGLVDDPMGENGNGDSEEDGECDNGVLLSDVLFVGLCACETGRRGMGTPCAWDDDVRGIWCGM